MGIPPPSTPKRFPHQCCLAKNRAAGIPGVTSGKVGGGGINNKKCEQLDVTVWFFQAPKTATLEIPAA